MLWLSAVLIAAVSNLDNLAVGVAFGMRGSRIATPPNLIIAAVTMAATAGAMTSGRALSHVLPSSVASWLGSLIIIAIGAWTVVASLRALRARARTTLPRSVRLGREVDARGVLSSREALVLGVALSLNNVGSGVGAGVAGIPPLATTLLAGLFSLLCVGGGSTLGISLRRNVLGGRAPLIAGVVLLFVGAAMLPGVR